MAHAGRLWALVVTALAAASSDPAMRPATFELRLPASERPVQTPVSHDDAEPPSAEPDGAPETLSERSQHALLHELQRRIFDVAGDVDEFDRHKRWLADKTLVKYVPLTLEPRRIPDIDAELDESETVLARARDVVSAPELRSDLDELFDSLGEQRRRYEALK